MSYIYRSSIKCVSAASLIFILVLSQFSVVINNSDLILLRFLLLDGFSYDCSLLSSATARLCVEVVKVKAIKTKTIVKIRGWNFHNLDIWYKETYRSSQQSASKLKLTVELNRSQLPFFYVTITLIKQYIGRHSGEWWWGESCDAENEMSKALKTNGFIECLTKVEI